MTQGVTFRFLITGYILCLLQVEEKLLIWIEKQLYNGLQLSAISDNFDDIELFIEQLHSFVEEEMFPSFRFSETFSLLTEVKTEEVGKNVVSLIFERQATCSKHLEHACLDAIVT